MSARVLFMDDNAERHRQFAKREPDSRRVWTARSAMLELKFRPRFDLVYLDHDLGVGVPQGMAVVDFICQMPPERRPLRVVVHSWNVPASLNLMLPALNRAGVPTTHEPFALEDGQDGHDGHDGHDGGSHV